jgi:hypothetical protein
VPARPTMATRLAPKATLSRRSLWGLAKGHFEQAHFFLNLMHGLVCQVDADMFTARYR